MSDIFHVWRVTQHSHTKGYCPPEEPMVHKYKERQRLCCAAQIHPLIIDLTEYSNYSTDFYGS